MTVAVFDQNDWRWRDDDGSETVATWLANAHTSINASTDTNIRLRFLVQETGGNMQNNAQIQVQYNKNSAGWNNVDGTSSNVRSSASGNFVEGDDTTQQLGSGTFITPNAGMDESNGTCGDSNEIDFAGSDEVEVEYCFQIRSADVANNDTINFRVLIDGAVTDAQTNGNASLTVSIATQASGSPTAQAPTSSAAASVETNASGASTAPVGNTSAVSAVEAIASGSATAPAPTSSGSATPLSVINASGTSTAQVPTSAANSTAEISAHGTSTAQAASPSGSGSSITSSNGAPTAQTPTSSGNANVIVGVINASGSPTAQAATSSGTIKLFEKRGKDWSSISGEATKTWTTIET